MFNIKLLLWWSSTGFNLFFCTQVSTHKNYYKTFLMIIYSSWHMIRFAKSPVTSSCDITQGLFYYHYYVFTYLFFKLILKPKSR